MNIEYFDKVYCICMADRKEHQKNLLAQLKHLYPDLIPIVFDAINTRYLNNHHVGCALSHRGIIQEAKNKGYKSILILEEDAIFRKDFSALLQDNINELKTLKWDVFYLGACVWNPTNDPKKFYPTAPDCKILQVPNRGATCTHGIAYHANIFDHILSSLPPKVDDMISWCNRFTAIDQWLRLLQHNGRCFIAHPRLVSQPFLIIGEPKQDHDFLNNPLADGAYLPS